MAFDIASRLSRISSQYRQTIMGSDIVDSICVGVVFNNVDEAKMGI